LPAPVLALQSDIDQKCNQLMWQVVSPLSERVIKAMRWKGNRGEGRNFFFEPDKFEDANRLLGSLGPTYDVDLWGKLSTAGFDTSILIKSQNGRTVIAQGRFLPALSKTDFMGNEVVVKEISILGENGIVRVPISGIVNRSQISISRVPYQLPDYLISATTNSEVAQKVGITDVSRFDSVEALVNFFNSRKIEPVVPKNRPGTEWNEAVYMSFRKGNDAQNKMFEFAGRRGSSVSAEMNEPVNMVFSTDLLNRPDFWVNEGWDLGQFNRSSIFNNDPNLRKALYLYSKHGIWGDRPEIVFAEGIPLNYLKKIYVRPGTKNKIIKSLRERVHDKRFDFDRLIVEHE